MDLPSFLTVPRVPYVSIVIQDFIERPAPSIIYIVLASRDEALVFLREAVNKCMGFRYKAKVGKNTDCIICV